MWRHALLEIKTNVFTWRCNNRKESILLDYFKELYVLYILFLWLPQLRFINIAVIFKQLRSLQHSVQEIQEYKKYKLWFYVFILTIYHTFHQSIHVQASHVGNTIPISQFSISAWPFCWPSYVIHITSTPATRFTYQV